MASNTRHGQNIINQTKDALGAPKFVASRQFQEFLDQLATLSNDFGDVLDLSQIGEINSTLIDRLGVQVRIDRLTSELGIIDLEQLVAVLDGLISALQTKERRMKDRVDDLEQLVHVN